MHVIKGEEREARNGIPIAREREAIWIEREREIAGEREREQEGRGEEEEEREIMREKEERKGEITPLLTEIISVARREESRRRRIIEYGP